MSQSTILIGAMVALFVLYLAAKGRLASYWAVFFGAPAASGPPSKSSGSSIGSTIGGIAGGIVGGPSGAGLGAAAGSGLGGLF